MKIVLVGPLGPDDFADNVGRVLTGMGHDVLTVGPSRPSLKIKPVAVASQIAFQRLPELDRRIQSRLTQMVRRARPELLLTVDRRLHRSVIEAARSVDAKTALWFPDHVANMDRHQMFLAGYDRIYIKNPEFVGRLYDIYGVPARYLPEAANAEWHRPFVEYGTRETVLMAGNVHPTRALLLDRLLSDGVPIEVYGAPISSWLDFPRVRAAHTGRYLARREKAEAFRSARAVLNNLHPGEFAGVNCRVFEAAASGAVVLTEARQGLGELFDPDLEVETFDSYKELRGKIDRLLASPDAGRPVADAAAKRAHREHTYEVRLEWMLRDLALVP